MNNFNPWQQQQANQYVQEQYGRNGYGQGYGQGFGQMQKPFPSIVPVPDELTARSAQIPMDGSNTFFLNEKAGEIYAKRLSMVDGSIIFEAYKRRECELPAKERYATVAQLDEITARLKRLEMPEGGNEA